MSNMTWSSLSSMWFACMNWCRVRLRLVRRKKTGTEGETQRPDPGWARAFRGLLLPRNPYSQAQGPERMFSKWSRLLWAAPIFSTELSYSCMAWFLIKQRRLLPAILPSAEWPIYHCPLGRPRRIHGDSWSPAATQPCPCLEWWLRAQDLNPQDLSSHSLLWSHLRDAGMKCIPRVKGQAKAQSFMPRSFHSKPQWGLLVN